MGMLIDELLMDSAPEQDTVEKVAADDVVAFIEKEAAAAGIDLSDLSDEDLAELMGVAATILAEESAPAEKTASEEDAEYQAGLRMGRGFLAAIAEAEEMAEKTAAANEDAFEQAAAERAADLLSYAVNGFDGEDALSKVAADEDLDMLLSARALEILDDNGYDVDAVLEAIAGE